MGDDADIVIVTTDPDPWAPDAVCDRCWPEERAEQARLKVEEGALYTTVRRDPAVTWGRLVALVGAAERLLRPPDADGDPRRRLRRRAALASLAAELSHDAQRLGGPMPYMVRAFIERSRRAAV